MFARVSWFWFSVCSSFGSVCHMEHIKLSISSLLLLIHAAINNLRFSTTCTRWCSMYTLCKPLWSMFSVSWFYCNWADNGVKLYKLSRSRVRGWNFQLPSRGTCQNFKNIPEFVLPKKCQNFVHGLHATIFQYWLKAGKMDCLHGRFEGICQFVCCLFKMNGILKGLRWWVL